MCTKDSKGRTLVDCYSCKCSQSQFPTHAPVTQTVVKNGQPILIRMCGRCGEIL